MLLHYFAPCSDAEFDAMFPHSGLILSQAFNDAASDGGTSNTAVLLFALGILLMLSILTRQLFRAYRRSRRKSPHKTVKQVREESAKLDARQQTPLVDAPAAYSRWHAEMYDVARQVQAEIDTKIRLLQATMRLADDTALRLQTTVERATAILESRLDSSDSPPSPEPSQESPAPSPQIPNSASADRPDLVGPTQQLREQTEQALRIVDQLDSQVTSSRNVDTHGTLPANPGPMGLRVFADRPKDEPRKATHARVRQLAEQGLSAAAIAKETGIPHGDVDLYLSTLPFNSQAETDSHRNDT